MYYFIVRNSLSSSMCRVKIQYDKPVAEEDIRIEQNRIE